MLLLQPSDLLRTVMYSNFLAFAIKLILQSYLNVLLRYSLMTLACEYLLQNGMFIVVLTTFVDVNFILLMASAYNFKCFMSFIKNKALLWTPLVDSFFAIYGRYLISDKLILFAFKVC